MALNDGYAFVGPKSPDTARALLETAASVNIEAWEVRTTVGGYIVPVKVAKKYEENLGAKPEPEVEADEKSDFPEESWKNAEIKEWATVHGVDLGEATKKADMLDAIRSAEKE